MLITGESPDLDGVWKVYREERRRLQEQLDSLEHEISSLSALYEECRNLWIQGEFKRLSEALDKVDFASYKELSEKLVGLREKASSVLKQLEATNRDLKEGIVCPKCDGLGSTVVERRYERLERQVIPIVKTQQCPVCKGAGKLHPNQPT